MSERLLRLPGPVKQSAPRGKPPDAHLTDRAGEGLLALLHEAATFSSQECDRVMDVAHDLSRQLALAQDRIERLQDEVDHFRGRATGAEKWLELIGKEVEERLLRPMWPM